MSYYRIMISSLTRGGSPGLKISRHLATNVKPRLEGKVAIVTASTDGIGFAIANRLVEDGVSVVVSSRKEANVEKAVQKIKDRGYTNVIGTVCHVGKKADREKLLQEAEKHFGGIDIFVSNAAVNPHFGPIIKCSEESWEKIFNVNVKSAFMLTKEVLPYIFKRGGGNIIYVASVAGYQPINIGQDPNIQMLGAYSVSKSALLGMTKAIANDLAKENVRVNCIAPGITRTRFSSAIYDNEVSRKVMTDMVPMGRFGEPEEMAGAVAFLCTDDARYITGETICITGGLASRM